jgi:hypothetical protein
MSAKKWGQTNKWKETAYLGEDREIYGYVLYSFTDRAVLPRIERGKINPMNDKIVLLGDPWGGFEVDADEMASRTTLIKKNNDEVSVLIERKDGKIWKKAREGTFHRIKTAGTR